MSSRWVAGQVTRSHTGTVGKPGLRGGHVGRDPVTHLFPAHVLAAHRCRPGSAVAHAVQPFLGPELLELLGEGVAAHQHRLDASAVHGPALDQQGVAGEQYPAFGLRPAQKAGRAGITVGGRVIAQKPQPAGETAKGAIDQKGTRGQKGAVRRSVIPGSPRPPRS